MFIYKPTLFLNNVIKSLTILNMSYHFKNMLPPREKSGFSPTRGHFFSFIYLIIFVPLRHFLNLFYFFFKSFSTPHTFHRCFLSKRFHRTLNSCYIKILEISVISSRSPCDQFKGTIYVLSDIFFLRSKDSSP